ncbi:alanine racemase [Alteromonas sp. KUL49]|uniref:alanine racemase n=1 Tax=Alteromonas sp. KUL49 TaxID=2480798 RepID=UPI00102EFCA7|nr:alanine racemase [Alteromonas sp. KUL49]TAP41507.1 DSD1 family PLP-dependent enzyme [Alteromonas sp. KUL49]GEA10599.1 alanine racemase [Alteromonas sp. KUL49]
MTDTLNSIAQLVTPCCLIEKSKLQGNIARLSAHIGELGCSLRPHVKTHKSVDVTKLIENGGNVRGITVSTLQEAQHFFKHGYTDILYAVGIVPNKLATAASLIEQGCDLKIVFDNTAMAAMVIEKAAEFSCTFKVLIELDTDGHRSGIEPSSQALLDIAGLVNQSQNIELCGVMTHAGESYSCFTHEEQLAMARQERDLTLLAAERLRAAGLECRVLSIGSTPTAFAIDDLTGITEVRAGVYAFFDLVMAGLNVCDVKDVAISVLASVIGHQTEKHWAITDAGWMAMSRDRGTANHPTDQGYGLVCDITGKALTDYIVNDANQEHGIIRHRDAKQPMNYDAFSLASMVRILPNHACSTAAQFSHYYLVDEGKVIEKWHVTRGW